MNIANMEAKLLYAQDVLSGHLGGQFYGGFNTRVLGDMNSNKFILYSDMRGLHGWQLANDMINDGELYYVHNFHDAHSDCPKGSGSPYGGTWACNTCNNDHFEKPWWIIKLFMDGNAWCCIGEDFEDLQASDNYAFGDSKESAIDNYAKLWSN